MTPRGRRPGSTDTRGAIVQAARVEFAEQGYDATSLRAVARRASVDPALVHHYFEGKPALFAAIMDIPVDPAVLIAGIVAGPHNQVGENLVRTFLTIWDSPQGRPRFEALLRSAVTHDDAARMLREFLTREIFARVIRGLEPEQGSGGDQELRAGLAASQMIGMALMRYVIGFPAVAEATQHELIEHLGPVIQGYLAPPAR